MKRDRIAYYFAALTAVLLLAGSWRWSEIRPGAGRSAEAVAAERAARADTSHDPAWRHATGAFGHPLGNHFTIEGEAVCIDLLGQRHAGKPNTFLVASVDGQPLKEPRYIWVEDLEKFGGIPHRLEGYEYERWLGDENSMVVIGFYPIFVPLKITRLK